MQSHGKLSSKQLLDSNIESIWAQILENKTVLMEVLQSARVHNVHSYMIVSIYIKKCRVYVGVYNRQVSYIFCDIIIIIIIIIIKWFFKFHLFKHRNWTWNISLLIENFLIPYGAGSIWSAQTGQEMNYSWLHHNTSVIFINLVNTLLSMSSVWLVYQSCVCVCVCLSVCLSVCLYVMHMSVYVCVCTCVFMSVYVFVHFKILVANDLNSVMSKYRFRWQFMN